MARTALISRIIIDWLKETLQIYVMQAEKCFVESTKIWLAQQNFSFQYGSIEILSESIKKYFYFFLQFQQTNFASSPKNGIAN